MGKVLILAAGEQTRWGNPMPKQIVPVYGEQLLARTVRQIRGLWNNYPCVVSHQKCLRTFSKNYICPSSHKMISDTLLSVNPIFGNDWSIVLLGDVIYTDELISTIYKNREKYKWHFYGNNEEIYALSFTDNDSVEHALENINGELWDLYYKLSDKSLPKAGEGYSGEEDDIHFSYVIDNTRDFNNFKEFQLWKRLNRKNDQ